MESIADAANASCLLHASADEGDEEKTTHCWNGMQRAISTPHLMGKMRIPRASAELVSEGLSDIHSSQVILGATIFEMEQAIDNETEA